MKLIWFSVFSRCNQMAQFHMANIHWVFGQCQESAEMFTCNILFNPWTTPVSGLLIFPVLQSRNWMWCACCLPLALPDVCLSLHPLCASGDWPMCITYASPLPLDYLGVWAVRIPDKETRATEEGNKFELNQIRQFCCCLCLFLFCLQG